MAPRKKSAKPAANATVEVVATSPDAVPSKLRVGGRLVVKVLQKGRSWHNSTNHYEWPLPTQQPDGSWVPGEWTPKVSLIYCKRGYHGTSCAPRWWGPDAVAWWLEYHPDARIITPEEGGPDSDGDKYCGEQCRLLRPLNREELEAQGVYLTGKHEEIGENGRTYVIGGDAEINYVRGGTINYVSGGTINYVRGGTINDVSGGTINDVRGGTINYVRGGTINDVRGGTINYVSGGTINDVRGGTIHTAHADGSSVIVIRPVSWAACTPTVVVRGRASALDYRTPRPTFHLADEGQVLTIAHDGTTSQLPAEEHDRLAAERAAQVKP